MSWPFNLGLYTKLLFEGNRRALSRTNYCILFQMCCIFSFRAAANLQVIEGATDITDTSNPVYNVQKVIVHDYDK